MKAVILRAALTLSNLLLKGHVMADVQTIVEYRDIQGFPGYRVGNDGSVWSCWQKRGKGKGNGAGCKSVLGTTWKRLTLKSHSKTGRICVTLAPGYTKRYVHSLVLEAFVGSCPHGMECCHFPDRHQANNALSNLRWDTHQANEADKKIHGTNPVGEKHWNARLTEKDVVEILARRAQGERLLSIALDKDISRSVVNTICLGGAWKHIIRPPKNPS